MILSLIILYKVFTQDTKPTSFQPVYHKTWKDEVEGYPASNYAKSLQVIVY